MGVVLRYRLEVYCQYFSEKSYGLGVPKQSPIISGLILVGLGVARMLTDWAPGDRDFLSCSAECREVFDDKMSSLFFPLSGKVQGVPAACARLHANFGEAWQTLANFGEPHNVIFTKTSPTFTRVPAKVPHLHQSSGEGAFCLWVAFRMCPTLSVHSCAIGDTISCDAPCSAIGSRGKLLLRYHLLGLSLECDGSFLRKKWGCSSDSLRCHRKDSATGVLLHLSRGRGEGGISVGSLRFSSGNPTEKLPPKIHCNFRSPNFKISSC